MRLKRRKTSRTSGTNITELIIR